VTSPIAPNSVVRRGDVLWRATLNGVLIRPPGADEVVKLAGTGLALWAELEQPTHFSDLCASLAAGHRADPNQIAADLMPVIVDLVERAVMAVSP
jgi:hypothetical protein